MIKYRKKFIYYRFDYRIRPKIKCTYLNNIILSTVKEEVQRNDIFMTSYGWLRVKDFKF